MTYIGTTHLIGCNGVRYNWAVGPAKELMRRWSRCMEAREDLPASGYGAEPTAAAVLLNGLKDLAVLRATHSAVLPVTPHLVHVDVDLVLQVAVTHSRCQERVSRLHEDKIRRGDEAATIPHSMSYLLIMENQTKMSEDRTDVSSYRSISDHGGNGHQDDNNEA